MIKNWIIISDMHSGCQHALCSEKVRLDGGGFYNASNSQLNLLNMWKSFWYEWVPKVTRGEPFGVINNGDCIDGIHHNSTTQISHNMEDQKNIAVQLLEPIVELCSGNYFHIRGTEAHVGKSAEFEESVARSLGAIPDEVGNYTRYELWLQMGEALAHFTHHIGTTGRTHYETSAVMAELAEHFVESGRNRQNPPDIVVRSHRHRNIEVRVPTKLGYGIAFVTAGWQLKTPFVHKIPGGRVTTPQIGGSLIRVGDEDVYTRHRVWHVDRPKAINAGEL